jgi:hypothetical protein
MPTEQIKPRFDILAEGTPQRCEICHQSDQFDPTTGTCARCGALPVPRAEVTFGTDVLRRFDIPERFRELVLREVGDEGVLWVGRPGLKWGSFAFYLTALVVILAVAGFFMTIDKVFGAIALSSCLPMIVPHLLQATRLFSRTRRVVYVVTENRALILLAGSEVSVTSFYPNQIQKLVYERNPEGRGNLTFCDPIPQANGQNSFDNGFYGIENLSDVERIVRTRLVEKHLS